MPEHVAEEDALLRRRLEEALGAERVRTDAATRHAHATDASPCAVEPRAVVRVLSEADVVRALRVCRELHVPVTPRASGTSLSGAAVGPGVVLDTTGFRRILDFSPHEGWVRVEPGILLSELDAFLRERGFFFPPDSGSRDLCRIGGMVGHNASGYRSVKYGHTREHVIRLRVVLADGTAINARDVPLQGDEWRELVERAPAFDAVRREIDAARPAVHRARRAIRKHSCGYDVFGIVDGLDRGVFPLASLFVGSEGTLGIVTEVTLRVHPAPAHRLTALLYLERFEDLGPAARDILFLRPSAIEAIDGDSLDLLGRQSLDIPASARAMLLVEFDEGNLDAQARALVHVAARYPLSRPVEVARDVARQEALWAVRRSVFPKIIQRGGRRKAWGFVEDPVVPPDRVPEFVRFLRDLARAHGTVAGIYGHIGDGNTHYRPFFDPLDPADFERMLSLRAEFDRAVLDVFGGAPSGEHGIGRIRADVLPRVWGPEVYSVMRTIKDALDPQRLLNPGVMFSSEPWWASWGGLESRIPM